MLSLLCCCLLFSACGGSKQGTPSATVETMAKAMQSEDVEAVMELLNPAVYAQPGAKEKLSGLLAASMAEMKEEEKGLKKIEILEEKINGERATVKAKYYYGNDTDDTQVMNLVKVDGKWYLDLM